MKKLILLLSTVICSIGYAQSNANAQPLVLVNDALSSTQQIEKMNQNNIASVHVYKKGNNLPKNLAQYKDRSNGIIVVKVKENYFDTTSVAHLNEQYGLDPKTPIYFNNMEITDQNMKILGESIHNLQIIEKNGIRMINIDTTINK